MGQVAVAKIGDRDDQRRGLVQRQPEGDLVRGSEAARRERRVGDDGTRPADGLGERRRGRAAVEGVAGVRRDQVVDPARENAVLQTAAPAVADGTAIAEQPAMAAPSLVNVTVPASGTGVTVAVSVTAAPGSEGLADVASVVLVTVVVGGWAIV